MITWICLALHHWTKDIVNLEKIQHDVHRSQMTWPYTRCSHMMAHVACILGGGGGGGECSTNYTYLGYPFQRYFLERGIIIQMPKSFKLSQLYLLFEIKEVIM